MAKNSLSVEFIDKVNYYVYVLVDSRDNTVFYVGKGHGNRVNAHVAEAVAGKDECNPEKNAMIREILATPGGDVMPYIVRYGLTEEEAYCVEAVLIDFIKSGIQIQSDKLTNIMGGHHSDENGLQTLEELNEKLTTGPLDVENLEDSILSVTVNQRRKDGNLYEAVRGNWPAAQATAETVDYVVAEYGGVIIGVFKPQRWYQADPDPNKTEKKRSWTRFDGEEVTDPEILDRYLYKRLPAKARGSQGSFRYFFKKK